MATEQESQGGQLEYFELANDKPVLDRNISPLRATMYMLIMAACGGATGYFVRDIQLKKEQEKGVRAESSLHISIGKLNADVYSFLEEIKHRPVTADDIKTMRDYLDDYRIHIDSHREIYGENAKTDAVTLEGGKGELQHVYELLQKVFKDLEREQREGPPQEKPVPEPIDIDRHVVGRKNEAPTVIAG